MLLIILTIVILKFVLSFRKKKYCLFFSSAVWVPREGALLLPQHCRQPSAWLCPSATPSPLMPSSYVLLHFLVQLLTLSGVRLQQVLREKPGQPQRQPVGNWKEKFPKSNSFLLGSEK